MSTKIMDEYEETIDDKGHVVSRKNIGATFMKNNKIEKTETVYIENASFWKEPNLLGWVIKDKQTGLYDWQNSNDLGNMDLDSDIPVEANAKKMYLDIKGSKNKSFIYIFEGEGLEKENLVSFKEAVNNIKNCWEKTKDKEKGIELEI